MTLQQNRQQDQQCLTCTLSTHVAMDSKIVWLVCLFYILTIINVINNHHFFLLLWS